MSMKVAVLSDIHSNAEALNAVLKEFPIDISEIWVLGDLIGYYYRSYEVLELLSKFPCRHIAGNHEHYLRQGMINSSLLQDYKSKYGSSLEISLKTLSSEQIAFLNSLPDSLEINIDSKKIMLCHGSPWNNDEYIYPDVKKEKLKEFNNLKADYIFLGHTHYPMKIKEGHKTVINPGSVGQPRNRRPGAHWAIFDTITKEVTFKVTSYSIDSLLQEINLYDPQNSYLKTVLTRT